MTALARRRRAARCRSRRSRARSRRPAESSSWPFAAGAVGLALAGAAPVLALALVGLALAGAGRGLGDVAATTLLQAHADDEVRSRVFAAQDGAAHVAFTLAALSGGLLVEVAERPRGVRGRGRLRRGRGAARPAAFHRDFHCGSACGKPLGGDGPSAWAIVEVARITSTTTPTSARAASAGVNATSIRTRALRYSP